MQQQPDRHVVPDTQHILPNSKPHVVNIQLPLSGQTHGCSEQLVHERARVLLLDGDLLVRLVEELPQAVGVVVHGDVQDPDVALIIEEEMTTS